ncbi:MAG: TIGR00730 family Rossman fold protein [Eubacterium sp.]|nr:TIGR00730 family Rossman fold protein [Eubacterium sp.]
MNICVFGAASVTIDKKYTDAVEIMGEHLAKNGHNLVFGSGSTGNMGAAARGFRKGGGKTHGVIPNFFKEDLNEFVDFTCDEMTYTESMRERKFVMEDLADAFIITPGGIGTFEEFFEILTLKQLGRHRKPIAVYNIDGYYDMLDNSINHSIEEGFIKESCRALFVVFDSLEGLLDYIENDDMQGLTIKDLK